MTGSDGEVMAMVSTGAQRADIVGRLIPHSQRPIACDKFIVQLAQRFTWREGAREGRRSGRNRRGGLIVKTGVCEVVTGLPNARQEGHAGARWAVKLHNQIAVVRVQDIDRDRHVGKGPQRIGGDGRSLPIEQDLASLDNDRAALARPARARRDGPRRLKQQLVARHQRDVTGVALAARDSGDIGAVAHRDVLSDQSNVAALAVAACGIGRQTCAGAGNGDVFRGRDRNRSAGSTAGRAAVDLRAAVEQEIVCDNGDVTGAAWFGRATARATP